MEIQCFLDPITFEVMEDAVSTPYGHSFSQKIITRWLENRPTCPLTNKPLHVGQLVPNFSLRNAIEQWRQNKTTPTISFEQVKLVKCIAKGSTGDVHEGIWMHQEVALKCLHFSHPSEAPLKEMEKQALVISKFSPPFSCHLLWHHSCSPKLLQGDGILQRRNSSGCHQRPPFLIALPPRVSKKCCLCTCLPTPTQTSSWKPQTN
eukprot:TRINITY_DN3309_c0_g3_i4.p1 TRINITY_DN3309_c0_g3~~TRINITY_DN3309_c0_g3_i4.p1  ORF type:complete len:205 (-),score=40.55 TRINITY_DN3309_c0_g3_i4:803-1417(-)